ncbi:tail fiber assembly protein [Chromobacterium haemolyticum]|uniref:tail fiber assembly protein n=1 Tax=Chromobacterium TaxID=535 RepID=UPI0006934D01|nr:tail fiber assembly protein [Chromobacterium haemolyticum]
MEQVQLDQVVMQYIERGLLMDLRMRRTMLLRECDWTQMQDAALSSEQKAAWQAYRQKLRDLPEAITDIKHVTWPVRPA